MQTVTSPDGTRIAYEQHGDGQPMVLVHGSSGTGRSFDPFVDHLADDFSLVVPDRRGRGDSGDTEAYSLQREVDDVKTVVEAFDEHVTLFGHSFGGLVALAAAETLSLDNLVLYEPALLVGDHREDDLSTRMVDARDTDGRQAAMKLFFKEAGGVPAPERLPFWPDDVAFHLVDTVIRESRAVEGYELSDDPDIDCPTLLLSGSEGPDHLHDAVDTLAARLSPSEHVEFDGIGHVGIESAPAAVADAVRQFQSTQQPEL